MASPSSRRTFALSLVLCVVLIPLLQVGLGYISIERMLPLPWFFGTPIVHLLIGGLGAFCATGGFPASPARGRGARLAVIGSLLGTFVAALIVAGYVILWAHDLQAQPPPAHPSRISTSPALGIFIIAFFFGPWFLMANLLGGGLAALGGILGGTLRAAISPEDTHAEELPGKGTSSISVALMIVLAAALPILISLIAQALIIGHNRR